MVKRDLLGTDLMISSDVGKAFNLDTIILSDFVRIPKNTNLIMDFGTGNSAIMLYLSKRFNGHILGVEIQEKRYLLAKENILNNNLSHRLEVINSDLKVFNHKKKADIIVSNPPYFKVNQETKQSLDTDMQIAKHEIYLNLETLILSVKKNIKHGGLFFMVHKADRLEEIILTLNQYDFKVKRIRFVHPSINHEPNQVLIEAKFKGSAHLIVLPPLIQYKEKGVYSDEMNSIYEGRNYQK
ncbi:tRNA1(Val) (adenine(37)-N6)-methyltransferase [Acholeplasma granularum]|uniref:tRNA1(Val) (adenine(37)-N6)-methyltransferase n=1 Tax=Acholeplasma granularum TaxID=264635 RepID=UPI0004B6872D|nr:methyltransferase [Acholeplasma granularum]